MLVLNSRIKDNGMVPKVATGKVGESYIDSALAEEPYIFNNRVSVLNDKNYKGFASKNRDK